ncbi:MAG: F0F1 ATP synthase subunit B' [Cyanobacteria bacterium]|jgi:F-type H+-transporting ATPase subunit b|nr:F0F1 ATP synthase subunit B' [Cyanobacteriota bacterium]
MTSWLLFAAEAGSQEGGLFDLDATLPLMALQVVLLTFILNALFFRPVGKAVEEREGYVNTSRAAAKEKLVQAERLESDLKDRLKEARLQSQQVILDAEQEMEQLHRAALSEATAAANASREKARREIDAEREKALGLLGTEAKSLGQMIVDRLLPA